MVSTKACRIFECLSNCLPLGISDARQNAESTTLKTRSKDIDDGFAGREHPFAEQEQRMIAKQSQSLMQRFAANQADATRIGMGDTSTLGFDFVDLMTKMMSDPTPVAKAQIDLF